MNVVDSEQNLTSKFSPVFDNMVTYTDRRVGPRYGYEMWTKMKQGTELTGTTTGTIETLLDSNIVTMHWTAHGLTPGKHVTLSGFTDIPTAISGITADMMNRTHSVRLATADTFQIIVPGYATASGISSSRTWDWVKDNHALGGEPVECRYFSNYIIVWTSVGEILAIDRFKTILRIWDADIANRVDPTLPGWSATDFVAHDVFGQELICSNGRDKPLKIDFTRIEGDWVRYVVDVPPTGPANNVNVPAFDACKSAFRFFTVHDTDRVNYDPQHVTQIRIAARDTSMVFTSAEKPGNAVDIDMSKIIASPEQTVRGFAIIKDALLVISPSSTTMMKYGTLVGVGDEQVHDPSAVDTLNGFGTNAPRTIVEIGSDVFMVDFNGVPSAKLSTLSNAVVPERVSNYIETMMSKHIGRIRKDTMRLKAFGLYDGKNRMIHFYLPNFDPVTVRELTGDPFYFDQDMANHEFLKRSLILRHDAHLLEQGDKVIIADATGFATLEPEDINGEREVVGVLSENYILVSIGKDLPREPLTNTNGGGNAVTIQPKYDASIGYIYHYVPQLKLTAWSRFKTPKGLKFNCGCGTLEGRTYLFTPDGYVMRYGSPDMPVYGDWKNMYDFVAWVSGTEYHVGDRVRDVDDDLVYKCIADTTSAGTSFQNARIADPDAWEEYKGEPVEFAWELPWSDFGARQNTKALRFCHIDANGQAQFKVDLFTDNIYKDASTGQFTPARSMTFVPNEAAAYGAGTQVYGAGRRTREQKLWQMPVKCKLLKIRTSGAVTASLSISAMSLLYQKGLMVRG